MDKMLKKHREKIDDIDSNLLKLLEERLSVVSTIGKIKKKHCVEAFQPHRWEEVLSNIKKLSENSEYITSEMISDIWNRIHDEALRIEAEK